MKCVAVGDMMIPSIYFRRELEKSSIIDEFICKSWKENSSKDDFREVIRKIETQVACAFEVEDEITELMKKADVIFVHQCPVSKEVIKEAENLKYILSCRGGVENIDMEAAKEKGVKVINCPAHNAYAVAEYTIGMILNELRNITRSCTALKNGEWREKYQKPVVLDEIAYEGNIQHGWGNLTGEEMLRRFWEAACRGGYPGHGETYLNKENILWWSHGGILHGESHKRFGFLLDRLKETPGLGLMPYSRTWDEVCAVPQEITPGEAECGCKEYYLIYYSFMRPTFREFHFDDQSKWHVRVLDTWNMTIDDRGTFTGKFKVTLPAKPYMAVQIWREGAEVHLK